MMKKSIHHSVNSISFVILWVSNGVKFWMHFKFIPVVLLITQIFTNYRIFSQNFCFFKTKFLYLQCGYQTKGNFVSIFLYKSFFL